jgi:hypothetical protein
MQANKEDIIPVVTVTITITRRFLYTKTFSKTMIVGEEFMYAQIRLHSVEGKTTKAILSRTYIGVFFMR